MAVVLADDRAAVRMINATLRGPAAEVLRRTVPELREVPTHRLYDLVLDDIALLYNCLCLFRRKRDWFQQVLVDAENRPVSDDNARLRCGHSTNDVVAMIVRTCAKRYFRRVLDDGERPGLIGRVAEALARARPGAESEPPGATRAERLYNAIKRYLRFDWQVPLIPYYAPLPVRLVLKLGPRLLELRDPQQLLDLITPRPEEQDHPPERPPQAVPGSSAALPELPPPVPAGPPPLRHGDGIDMVEAFWKVLAEPEVTEVLGHSSGKEHRQLAVRLASVSTAMLDALCGRLGLSAAQATVFLKGLDDHMERPRFTAAFCKPGDPLLIARLMDRARRAGMTSATPLAGVAAVVAGLMEEYQEDPAQFYLS